MPLGAGAVFWLAGTMPGIYSLGNSMTPAAVSSLHVAISSAAIKNRSLLFWPVHAIIDTDGQEASPLRLLTLDAMVRGSGLFIAAPEKKI